MITLDSCRVFVWPSTNNQWQVIIVTGGGEFTISSSASSLTMSNIRIEVTGHTALYMDVPELIMTGIDKSVSVAMVASFLFSVRTLSGIVCGDLACVFSTKPSAQCRFVPVADA